MQSDYQHRQRYLQEPVDLQQPPDNKQIHLSTQYITFNVHLLYNVLLIHLSIASVAIYIYIIIPTKHIPTKIRGFHTCYYLTMSMPMYLYINFYNQTHTVHTIIHTNIHTQYCIRCNTYIHYTTYKHIPTK